MLCKTEDIVPSEQMYILALLQQNILTLLSASLDVHCLL